MRTARARRFVVTVLLGMAAASLPGVASAGLPPGGSFTDDNGNVHEANIEAIAAEGITRGCNPPANDRYCPGSTVTRGQMAAFLVRAFGYAKTGDGTRFVDDDDSIFEADIEALAANGVTLGCNPPANDRFCPDDRVTRQQMAAFLVRAFGYTDAGTRDFFRDDNGSIFEDSIQKLRVAGVTLGCNPPANDRYCPTDPVRRDQMASFLGRALGLAPVIPPAPGTAPIPPNPSPSGLACDFNGDGYEDIPVGVPGEDIGSLVDAGAIVAIRSAPGATGANDGGLFLAQIFLTGPGTTDGPESDDRFGSAVECGDFNGDGWADLAVGAPGEDLAGDEDAGAVDIYYGSSAGLDGDGEYFTQASPGVLGDALSFDGFGTSLAAGDFNGDGFADLAIGVPGEDATVGATTEDKILTGGVNVLYGSPWGLAVSGNQLFTQDTAGVLGVAEAGDQMGAAIAAGDVNGDGFDDLVVGAPGDGVGGDSSAGSVNLLLGSTGGLATAGNQLWSLDSAGVPGDPAPGDEFGRSVAVGDLDGDGKADLAVGIPGKTVGAATAAGMVAVLEGAPGGLTATGSSLWSQDSAGVEGDPKSGDLFGWSVSIGRIDADAFGDLVIGIPLQDAAGVPAGGVAILYGSAAGVTSAGNQLLTQATSGVVGDPEDLDSMGETVRVFDVDGNGFGDVVVGIPEETVNDVVDAGAIAVFPGTASGLTVTGNVLLSEDTAEIPDWAEANDYFGYVGPLQRSLSAVPTSSRLDTAWLSGTARSGRS